MKPYIHALSSVKKYGGKVEDYIDIHNFMDSSKSHIPDVRHRAIFHSSFGCFIVEQLFGVTRTNSAGKVYSVRDVAEDHIMEDLGTIPTVSDWFKNIPIENWMCGKSRKVEKEIPKSTEDYIVDAKEILDECEKSNPIKSIPIQPMYPTPVWPTPRYTTPVYPTPIQQPDYPTPVWPNPYVTD